MANKAFDNFGGGSGGSSSSSSSSSSTDETQRGAQRAFDRNQELDEQASTSGSSGSGSTSSGSESSSASPDVVEGASGGTERLGVEDAEGDLGEQAREFERQVAENNSLSAEDVRITQDGNQLSAELTSSGRSELTSRNQRVARGAAQAVSSDVGFEDALLEEARERNERTVRGTASAVSSDPGFGDKQSRKKERFGDFDLSFGLGGPEDEVENAIEDASNTITNTTQDAGDFLFSEDFSGQSAGAAALDFVGQEQLARRYDRGLRNFGRGLVEGGGAILNVPGLAKTGIEAAEFGAWTVSEGLKDSSSTQAQIEAAATAAIDEGIEAVKTNPAKSVGQLAGSAVASTAAIGTASKVSSRAGSATRFAIQPGEEIATRGATKLAGKTATGQRVLSKLPNGRIDNEELVIETSKSGVKRVRSGFGDLLKDDRAMVGGGRRRSSSSQSSFPEQTTIEKTLEIDDTTTIEDIDNPDALSKKSRAELTRRSLEQDTTSLDEMDIETRARRRLPDESEFESRSEFDRELEGMMRRIEEENVDTTSTAADDIATQKLSSEGTTKSPGGDALETSLEIDRPSGRRGLETALSNETLSDEGVQKTLFDTRGSLGTGTESLLTPTTTTGLDKTLTIDTGLTTGRSVDTGLSADLTVDTTADTTVDSTVDFESEVITELSSKSDRKIEVDDPFDPVTSPTSGRRRRSGFRKTFSSNVATPEDVLRGATSDEESFLGL